MISLALLLYPGFGLAPYIDIFSVAREHSQKKILGEILDLGVSTHC